MTTTTIQTQIGTTAATATERPLTLGIGLAGRVMVTWAVAGGVLAGGFLVGALTLAGRLSAADLFLTSTGLYLVGAALGALHGAVLGFLGRDAGVGRRQAAAALGLALAYTVPALAVAWVVTGWIAMTTLALYGGGTAALVFTGAAWLVGAALVAKAAVTGYRALRNGYARWQERVAGTLVVTGGFAALVATLLNTHVWGTPYRMPASTLVLLALTITLWVVGPLATVGLRRRAAVGRRA
jgi:hypothetical protein